MASPAHEQHDDHADSGGDHDDHRVDDRDSGAQKKADVPFLERARRWRQDHPRALVGIIVGVIALVAAGIAFFLYERTFVSTDDAEIDGNISSIGARVPGVVTHVYVEDNQHVNVGDPIADLDLADLEVAVAKAEADLALAQAENEASAPAVPITEQTNKTQIANSGGDIATASAQLAAAKKDAEAAKARVDQARAQARLADVDRVRSQALVKSGAVSQADLDQKAAASEAAESEVASADSALKAAEARVAQLEAQVGEARNRLEETKANAPKQVEIQKANVTSREAQIQAAQAELAQAKQNLSYGKIVAPVSGVIGKKSVNVGDHVEPGQPLVAIVQTSDLWVTANFKETQLEKMHPGERVKVHVDAYGTTFTGKVESMPGASGAKYSLFPPENATGNYVKVVQRLPVRLRLDPNQPGLDLLRPGMSVEPKVYVR